MALTILIADDEDDVRLLMGHCLKNAGFRVIQSEDGQQALSLARQEVPDLLILDINMPKMDGLEVCRALKCDPSTARTPIVLLTARGEELDRIIGLELGADDYVTKPFSPRELILRIKSVLRKDDAEDGPSSMQIGSVFIDRERHEVLLNNEIVKLTATEFRLLVLLAERRGRIQSRDVLLNEVWCYESVIDTRTVDTHVRRLREKLGPAANCIETIRGFGYRIGD